MVLPLWRSLHSVNLMLPKEDRRAMLLRIFNDEPQLLNITQGGTPPASTSVTTNEDEPAIEYDFEFDPPESKNPWNLLPKWPATRRHRMAELDFMATYYNTVGQEENIKAAKAWHGTFPPEDLIGHETAYFYQGQKVERSEVDLQKAPVWIEVSYSLTLTPRDNN